MICSTKKTRFIVYQTKETGQEQRLFYNGIIPEREKIKRKTMDYKKKIIKMLDEIEDIDLLRKIYTFILTWVNIGR